MQRTPVSAISFRLGALRPRTLGLVRVALFAWLTAPAVPLFATAAVAFLVSSHDVDPRAQRELPLDATVVEGRVEAVAAVRTQWKGSRDRHVVGYDVDVSFPHDGALHSVRRFVPSSSPRPNPGESISVRFDPRAPSRAHVDGTRSLPGDASFATVVFALLAFGAFIQGAVRARGRVALLTHGALASGTLRGQRSENGWWKRVRVLTFGYEVKGQEYLCEARTRSPRPLVDEAREPLVYDDATPERAFLLDELALAPRVGDDGMVTLQNPGRIWIAVVAWVIVLPLSLVAIAYPFIANRS